MEQTAIQQEPPKATETAILSGLPGPIPEARPAAAPKHPVAAALGMLADLRLTVTLFVLAMLIVFWGTLAQVDFGVWTVVNNYFRSFFVWVPMKVILFNTIEEQGMSIPFPGGWLVGSIMFINLLAAHAIRFKLTWGRTGIILTHAGIIIMMVGELITGLYAVEGNMMIKIGQTTSEVIHPTESEFAIIRRIDAQKDEVVTVPSHQLIKDSTVEHADMPFKLHVLEYMKNCEIKNVPGNNRADKGFGKVHVAVEVPEVNGVDPNQKHDMPAMRAKLLDREGKAMGTWLFWVGFSDPQWVTIDGKQYQLSLRFKQVSRPYQFQLTQFDHKLFPGSDKPKDFRSFIHITDKEHNLERDVEIYMNNPLYYRGETFYQSSWTPDVNGKADGTVLQVVRNPGWLLPYVSCGVVGFGLLIHFGLTLYRFAQRRMA